VRATGASSTRAPAFFVTCNHCLACWRDVIQAAATTVHTTAMLQHDVNALPIRHNARRSRVSGSSSGLAPGLGEKTKLHTLLRALKHALRAGAGLTLLLSLRFMSLVFEEARNIAMGLAARNVDWKAQVPFWGSPRCMSTAASWPADGDAYATDV